MILFNEEKHSYTFNDQEFVSVTKIIKSLEQPKDWDEIAEKYGKKHNLTKEEVLLAWKTKGDQAAQKGTKYHKLREDELIDKGAYPIIETPQGKQAYDLKNLNPGIYPELILYMLSHRICGTSDKVIINEDRTFHVYDFKGLALDTPIATRTGWKQILDINVGDEIFDGDGNLTKVKNISEIHYNPCYKITFDTGDTIMCDHEHRWVITQEDRYKKVFNNTELTTEQLKVKFDNKNQPILIPCVSLNLPEVDLPIDPYVLGLWLGDGNRTCGTITCVNPDIWEEIERRGYKTSVNHNRTQDRAESRTIFGISPELRKLGLIGNKHLPEIYMRSSYEQRLDLLRGFMDADGHYNKTRKRCVMITTKLWQADGLMELCSSLGFKPTKMKGVTSGFGKTNIPCIHVCFSPSVNPFLIRNKDYIQQLGNKNMYISKFRYITNIEEVEMVPTKCLEVESDTHCYLAGRNLIKTHNTNAKLRSSGDMEFYWNPKKKIKEKERLVSPVSHLYNCEIDKYTLQLSCYAYMLEQYDFECTGLTIEHILFNEDDTYKESNIIPIPYLRDEAKNVINWYYKSFIK